MALTETLTTDAERVQRWTSVAWYELPRKIFWGKFMSERSDEAIIEIKRDLEGQPGDRLNFTLVNKLVGAGVTGDDQLEGQEELLDLDTDSVTLQQRRNAVRLKGRLSQKRTAVDQEKASETQLKVWMAETVDDRIYTELTTAPTRSIFGGTATSRATLTTTMTITPARVDACVNAAYTADPKVWPVRVEGDDYYVLVMHTDSWYDMRQNGVWQGYQQNGAQLQGKQNPIFNGRAGLYNETVLFHHEKIPVGTDGGSGGDVPYAVNLFLGRQAAVFAWGARPQAWVKEFDYNNSTGYAIGAIFEVRKAVFAGVDHAVIALQVARTQNRTV